MLSLIITVVQLISWSVKCFGPVGNIGDTGELVFFAFTLYNLYSNGKSTQAIPLIEGIVAVLALLAQIWFPKVLSIGGWTLPGGWPTVALVVLVVTNLFDQKNSSG